MGTKDPNASKIREKIGISAVRRGKNRSGGGLGNAPPVDGGGAAQGELLPQQTVPGLLQVGVGIQNVPGGFVGVLQDVLVGREVGNLQIGHFAALTGTFDLSLSTQLQVGFGNPETVGSLNHGFQPFPAGL